MSRSIAHRGPHSIGRSGSLLLALVALALASGAVIATTINGGRSSAQLSQRVVGAPASGPLSAAAHAPDPAAAGAARAFLAGYLAFIYGQAPVEEIQDASPHLIALLRRARPQATTASARPRVVTLGAREASGSVLHVTALISDGITRYPMGIVMVHEPRGWETTELASAE